MTKRVTLKQIAEACGVSIATVSYALRKSSHIPESTRTRIQQTAERLGYRPDPELASLAARKNRSGKLGFYASVAVLYPNPESSRATRLFATHSKHFKERMQDYGCSVSDFQVDSNRYRPARLAQILHTRGIRGILLGWGNWPDSASEFPWHEFAVVSTERTDLSESIDKVSMNHFHALDDIFERLDHWSHQRYGLILHDDCPPETRSLILGSYYANLFERPRLESSIPPYAYHLGEDGSSLRKWYRAYQPEVIISHRVIEPAMFNAAGIQFPKPTRLVVIEIDESSPVAYTGLYTEGELGRTIATLLARKMRNDEVEAGRFRKRLTLVNGIWHDGETLGD
ncbi:LacI family DNA-binding transcriptional regulator [Coraliomargarita parva]|uniref:LacI family DNA-binding transcriptional regulator n=1 Tax=Coraliomargarita parva TaxID=3014050 RepID=UPI0022B4C456|nr:LacI family DNA-binding transcriptional regulator [Coraliomargarita parva]